MLDQALDGREPRIPGKEEQRPRGSVVEHEMSGRPFDDGLRAAPERAEHMRGERIPGVAADVDPQVHRVAGTARKPRFAGRPTLESLEPHGRTLAGEVAQHPRALDPEMHDRVVVRGGLDPRHPRPHALPRDVAGARRLGGFHDQAAAGRDRAEQRISGPLLGVGDDVVVEADTLDLTGDDSRPAFPAAPVGATERRRPPCP